MPLNGVLLVLRVNGITKSSPRHDHAEIGPYDKTSCSRVTDKLRTHDPSNTHKATAHFNFRIKCTVNGVLHFLLIIQTASRNIIWPLHWRFLVFIIFKCIYFYSMECLHIYSNYIMFVIYNKMGLDYKLFALQSISPSTYNFTFMHTVVHLVKKLCIHRCI